MKDVVSEYLPQSLPQAQQDNPYYNPTFQGDPDYLEDKFVRFGYRFKYDDGEYSVFSPLLKKLLYLSKMVTFCLIQVD